MEEIEDIELLRLVERSFEVQMVEVTGSSIAVDTPEDLVKMGICDKIIREPNGGAHRDFDSSANKLKEELIKELEIITKFDRDQFLDNRILKYDKLGYFNSIWLNTTFLLKFITKM